jgi:hypothetical protein
VFTVEHYRRDEWGNLTLISSERFDDWSLVAVYVLANDPAYPAMEIRITCRASAPGDA